MRDQKSERSGEESDSQDALRQRCKRTIEWCRAYDGPDKLGALMGELDCLVELEILKEKEQRAGKEAEIKGD